MSAKDEKGIFDKEVILRLFLDERRSLDIQAGLMWENVKYFTAIITALIAADAFLMNLLLNLEIEGQQRIIVMLPFLPFVIVVAAFLGSVELTSRGLRFMETIAHLGKFEELLGLDKEVKGKMDSFPEDIHLHERYYKSKFKRAPDGSLFYPTTEAFVRGELRGKNMYSRLILVHIITSAVGFALALMHIMLSFEVDDLAWPIIALGIVSVTYYAMRRESLQRIIGKLPPN